MGKQKNKYIVMVKWKQFTISNPLLLVSLQNTSEYSHFLCKTLIIKEKETIKLNSLKGHRDNIEVNNIGMV